MHSRASRTHCTVLATRIHTGIKMQCFICMTYMIFICTAQPSKDREPSNQHEKRSLFRDVIESLRIRSQIPDEYNQNDENNLAQNYERYGYENYPQLPSDADLIPRRNDRIEMPPLKYRFPKSINFTDESDNGKEEFVLYINTTNEPKPSTQKPKKQKKPRPPANKNKNPNKNKEDEEIEDEGFNQKPDEYPPFTNTMAGQSQIGNRESQMVVKPTVIVNIRGTVSHRDSDIKIEGKSKNSNETMPDVPQNVFNIKQEIKLERNFAGIGSNGGQKDPEVRQNIRIVSSNDAKGEEDMMMCETATFSPEKTGREGRKYDNILQILFSLQN